MRIRNIVARFRHDDRGAVTEEYSYVGFLSASIITFLVGIIQSDFFRALLESVITKLLGSLVAIALRMVV